MSCSEENARGRRKLFAVRLIAFMLVIDAVDFKIKIVDTGGNVFGRRPFALCLFIKPDIGY